MSTDHDNFVEPESSTAKTQADELFIHGVMQQLYQDTDTARESRIQGVLSRLDTDAGIPHARVSRFNFAARYPRFIRVALAAAASLTLMVSLTYIGIGTEKSADATVQATIAAMRSSGDRRFEVRAKLETEKDLGKEPMAVIDTRAPNLMLLRSKGPDNHSITVGRDGDGPWAIRRDGSVERDNPEVRWPRWAMLGDESLFADSVDQLLETMSDAYEIKKSAASTLSGRGDTRFTHLTGTKRRAMQPGPRQIDLWIDDSSKIVERIEMHFERPPQNQGGPGGPGGRPFGPPNGRPNGTFSGDGPDGEHRPPRDGAEGEGGPGAGGERHVIGDGAGPGPRGPRMGPPGRLDPRRGPRGERLPPLELLVIDRVNPPVFADDYFKPQTYNKPEAGVEPTK